MAKRFPPPDGSYRFVLRRYDRSPKLEWFEPGYDDQATSRNILLGGVEAPTIFLRSKGLRDRLVKLGWFDETEAWEARPRWDDPWVEGGRPFPDLDGPDRAVLSALLVGHRDGSRLFGARQLAEAAKVDRLTLQGSIKVLRKRDLLFKSGRAASARYAASRKAVSAVGMGPSSNYEKDANDQQPAASA